MAIAVFGIFQALVGFQGETLTILRQHLRLATPQLLITHAAARLDHAGGGEVIEVHQQVRCQAVKIAGFIRQKRQYSGQTKGFSAYINTVAGLEVQGDKQACFCPGFTGLWTGTNLLGVIQIGGTFKCAAQWVGAVRGLDAGQLNACVIGDHAGKFHQLSVIKTQFLAQADLLWRIG